MKQEQRGSCLAGIKAAALNTYACENVVQDPQRGTFLAPRLAPIGRQSRPFQRNVRTCSLATLENRTLARFDVCIDKMRKVSGHL